MYDYFDHIRESSPEDIDDVEINYNEYVNTVNRIMTESAYAIRDVIDDSAETIVFPSI